jgi:hypothetical protein
VRRSSIEPSKKLAVLDVSSLMEHEDFLRALIDYDIALVTPPT